LEQWTLFMCSANNFKLGPFRRSGVNRAQIGLNLIMARVPLTRLKAKHGGRSRN
jgi:hypothetical protein